MEADLLVQRRGVRARVGRMVWLWVSVACAGIGVLVGGLFVPSASIGAAALDGVLVTIGWLGLRQSAIEERIDHGRGVAAAAYVGGVLGVGAGCGIAVAGLFRMLGVAAWVVTGVIVSTCPWLWSSARRAVR